MSPQPLASRVERLERRMTALEELPARVGALESQIVQLRSEMRGEFSALRGEIGQVRDDLRGEMKAMGDRLEAAIQESRDHARALFEDVIERLARIGEGSSHRPRRKR